ncbi:hypothetical protein A4H97_20565 [Niastella yeongjuensis]|uniref:Uncharacterized protein n=1 Tax=Niastella yeongjuensis TaxID=354355 RepID=A0A1V9FC65_9BACT|nr:hypothetical protein [Niastella yeongjuensis]OQP55983.1 hypothetical protein A4H97_20565 [Niastella yeongjuensis]SEP25708.1 hypothetical protein SAMN05660816_04963 [Niastella yeongjuensis]
MKGLTTSWKAFRTACIVQLILVAFKGMFSFREVFIQNNALVGFINIIAYALVFIFVYHGLSMLNYNYPDVPLSPKQKRWFNILYLINFILIAFLFAQIINNWWMARFVFDLGTFNASKAAWLYGSALFSISWFIFIIHFVFLAGMFKLRRAIHENTINTWYDQFDQKP